MVIAFERVTLYGLTLISRRRVHYGPINPAEAREVFLRQGLAACEYVTKAPFFVHNQALIREIRELEHKARRPDVLVDDEALFRFYDALVPQGIHNGASFETWRKEAEAKQPRLLFTHARVPDAPFRRGRERGAVSGNAAGRAASSCRSNTASIPAIALDGVTLTVPLHLLNQLDAARVRVAGAGHDPRKSCRLFERPAQAIAQAFCTGAGERY